MWNLPGSTWIRWSKIDDEKQKPYYIGICEWCLKYIPCTEIIHPDPLEDRKGKGQGWVYRNKGPYF